MAKLFSIIAGALALASAASAASVPRTCGNIRAPYTIIELDATNTTQPGIQGDLFVAHQAFGPHGEKSSTVSLLRFEVPVGQSNCQLSANFPPARFGYPELHTVGQPPFLLDIFLIDGEVPARPTFADLKLVPGPWGTVALNPGQTIINADPCKAGNFLFKIPDYVQGQNGVSFYNDIKDYANDIDNSFGFFIHYNC